jgi:molybdopterin converting factor subunit 1
MPTKKMTIKILMFGIAKEIAGGTSVEIEVDDQMTVQRLRTLLEERYPRLKQLSSFMIALNNEYAAGEELISKNDEIAVIPPVSGG